MADEQLHPLGQRLVGREGGEQLVGALAEDVDLVAVHRLDERLARGEVPVQRADADAGVAGDVLEGDLGAAGGEGGGGGVDQELAVAHRVGAERRSADAESAGSIASRSAGALHVPRLVTIPHLQNGGSLRILPEEASVSTSYPIWRSLMPPTATLSRPTGRATQRRAPPGLVLGIILAVQLMVVLDATIVNIALPDIASALNFSPASLSWVITAYTLAFGGFLLLGARAGDLLGRKRVFMAGIGLFTFASFLGGLAPIGAACCSRRARCRAWVERSRHRRRWPS